VVAERGGCEREGCVGEERLREEGCVRGKFWERGKASGAVEFVRSFVKYGGLGRAVCERLVLTSGSEDKPYRG